MNNKLKNFFSTTKSVAKRSTVAILCTVLVSVFATTSCDKLRNLKVDELAESLSTIPVTTTDYSLEGSGCSWNFAAMAADSVFVIAIAQAVLQFIRRKANT